MYSRQRHSIDQTFHLEQIVDLPKGTAFTGDASSTGIKELNRPNREQPEKLRSNLPLGSTNGHSQQESNEEGTTFRVPQEIPTEGERKRKHISADTRQGAQSGSEDERSEKRKKAKTAHSQNTEQDGSSPRKEKGKHKEKGEHKSGKKHRDETSEEKRERKEKKKKRNSS